MSMMDRRLQENDDLNAAMKDLQQAKIELIKAETAKIRAETLKINREFLFPTKHYQVSNGIKYEVKDDGEGNLNWIEQPKPKSPPGTPR
jgi:hypothetical protein